MVFITTCLFERNDILYDWSNCLLGAVLVAALRSHGEASVAVAEEGVVVIGHLCADNAANRTSLGEADACAGVYKLISRCLCTCVSLCLSFERFFGRQPAYVMRPILSVSYIYKPQYINMFRNTLF